MTRRSVVVAATVAALVSTIGGLLTWQRLRKPTLAVALPQGPQASAEHPSLPFDELAIKLATRPSGGTITETVPPGTSIFVRFWTRPPARALRIEARQAHGPVTRHEIPAAPAQLVPPGELNPQCDTAFAAVRALLSAVSVAEAERAERSAESLSSRAPCPQVGGYANAVFLHSRPRTDVWWRLAAGQQLHLKVETVEPAGTLPTTWDVRLTAEPPGARWAYANEEEWLAWLIARDVASLLWHASGASSAPPAVTSQALRKTPLGAVAVQVEQSLPGESALVHEIALDPHVFDPKLYDGFARALADRLKVSPPPGEPADGLLGRLLDLQGETLARESARVSARLTRAPLDPAANADAALLHVALALRESAGRFADGRPALARATAHLAVAGLAPAASTAVTRIAHAGVLALAGRQVDALASLDGVIAAARTTPAERAWVRALRLRVTEDWRLVQAREKPSLLERLQLYRARRASLGGLIALDMFAGRRIEPVADWAWIALDGSVTVQEGNMFATAAFPMTLAELGRVLLHEEGPDVSPAAVAARIHPAPPSTAVVWDERGPAAQVLDAGVWSAFYARHLVHAVDAAHEHLRSRLGAPEAAEEFAAEAAPYLEGTPWPVALEPLRQERDRAVRLEPPSCSDFAPWPAKNPETTPVVSWSAFMTQCRPGAIAPLEQWFGWPGVGGTTVGARARRAASFRIANPEAVVRLRAVAPYDQNIAAMALNRTGKSEDAAAVTEAMGLRKEYTLSVMRRIARTAEKAERRKTLATLCDFSADDCPALGAELVAAGDTAAAVKAYERALAGARDRVGVSHDMNWLAGHYLDTNRPADAERVAQAAAAVGSAAGLDLLGTVLERRSRLREAEAVFRALDSRYNDHTPLDSFYIRAHERHGDARYEEHARQAMARLFPRGLERVSLADFTAPPRDGAEVTKVSEGARALGAGVGDVVVAADGYRVQTAAQYNVIRDLQRDAPLSFVIWNQQRGYATAEGRFPGRRVGWLLRDRGQRP
jgi:hypothetical protein